MRRSLALAVLVLVALVACDNPPAAPSIIITNNNNNTNNNGQGTPSPSPSPSAGAIARVTVGTFGQSCPAGVTPAAAGSRQMRVLCSYDVTCTPRDATGAQLPESVHGPDAAWSASPTGLVEILTGGSNAFNVIASARAPGVVTIACAVKGVTGSTQYEVVR
jgi:hypothetical protein